MSCLLGTCSKSFWLNDTGDFQPSRELVLEFRNVNVYAIFCEFGSKMKKLLDFIQSLK